MKSEGHCLNLHNAMESEVVVKMWTLFLSHSFILADVGILIIP